MKRFHIIVLFAFFTRTIIESRSIYRQMDSSVGSIHIRWNKCKRSFTITNPNLGINIFTVFDPIVLKNHLLPDNEIPFRYAPNVSVPGTVLSKQINELVKEINLGKRAYTHFDVIKRRNFNFKTKTGLLIVRFKHYPFIVKLFIETPESLAHPLNKGLEPICFFYMGKGMSRHLVGFTRIPNLEVVKKLLARNNHWKKIVDVPRKWYWESSDTPYLHVKGEKIGGHALQETSFPAIYAVIADEIIWERQFSLSSQSDRRCAMELSNFLEQRIDPHINNFGIERTSGKIVLIDFEHFPTVLGLDPQKRYRGYCHWYTHLTSKMLNETYFQTKLNRYKKQQSCK